jgi:ANTAR domain
VRDVTAEHEGRERRAAAARVAAELSAADDLTDVVATVVSGFGELFDGEVRVRVVVGGEQRVFTTRGPGNEPTEHVSRHPPAVRVTCRAEREGAGADGTVDGVRFGDGADGSQVLVAFDRPRRVGSDERVVGDLLHRAFALALERVVAATAFADREQHLRRAIESHEAIGQAVGILVERHRWTPAAAFDLLKKVSQDHNVRLREVAEKVVVSGADPGLVGR